MTATQYQRAEPRVMSRTDIAIKRAGVLLRADVKEQRLRDIARYDRDLYFRDAGKMGGEHLYGRQLDTLLDQREHWEGDIDYTRMVLEAIRQRLWDAYRHDYFICDTRTMKTAYFGELRLLREQRAMQQAAE